jgi:acetyltransferase
MALVAEAASEIIGVGRLSKLHGEAEAEFAVVVRDRFQGLGVGTELLGALIEVARREDVARIVGYVLPENRGMQRLCEKVGFQLHYDTDEGALRAEIDLHGPSPVLSGADRGISTDRAVGLSRSHPLGNTLTE